MATHPKASPNVDRTYPIDAPLPLPVALDTLHRRGVGATRSTLYAWDRAERAAGRPGLIHRPGGYKGRTYVVPAEVEAFIRADRPAPAPRKSTPPVKRAPRRNREPGMIG